MGYLRLLLALGVLGEHAGILADSTARTMVSAFFLLSGFLMPLTLERNYSGAAFPFYWNRILRVYPLHIISTFLILMLWPRWAFGRFDHASGEPFYFQLFKTLSLSFSGSQLLNGPAWTLPYELLYYLAAPLLVRFQLRGYLVYLVVGLLLCSPHVPFGAFQYTFVQPLGPSIAASAVLFGAGGLAYFVRKRFNVRSRSVLILALPTLAIATQVLTTCRFFNPSWIQFAETWGVLMSELVALAIFAFLVLTPLEKESALSKYCGDLCYPVYLLHWPLFQVWFDGASWPSTTFSSFAHLIPYGDYWIKLVTGTLITLFAAQVWVRLDRTIIRRARCRWTSVAVSDTHPALKAVLRAE